MHRAGRTSQRPRAAVAAALLCATALIGSAPEVQALPPGTPPAGVVVLSPSSGSASTTFTLSPPPDATCPTIVHSFIVPAGTDPATVTFSPSGRPDNVTGFSSNLATPAGSRVRFVLANAVDGVIDPIPGLSFGSELFGSMPAGSYTVGLACVDTTFDDDGVFRVFSVAYWSTALTIAGSLAFGTLQYSSPDISHPAAPPGRPTIDSAVPGNGTCTVSFTPGRGSATGFTLAGLPSGLVTGTSSPLTLTGLANGVTYELTVRAVNDVGRSEPSMPATCTPVAPPPPPPPSGRIEGEGSAWAANLVDDIRIAFWQGGAPVSVDYNPSGSTSGRREFLSGFVSFAVSDVPFQTNPDDGSAPERPLAGTYSYVPFSAGGLAFAYNLRIDGATVTNLRLSGATIAAIFNGTILRWNDPVIAADNPGLRLPDLAITPVVRSDRSGTSLQFAAWLADQHPAAWSTLCSRAGRGPSCTPSQSFPLVQGTVAQAGDPGVANLLLSPLTSGTIGYVNYTYALGFGLPVAEVRNAAGYYVEPSGGNVAMALRRAVVRDTPADVSTHMTADLRQVYTDPDPRSYPISYYSYLIVPGPIRTMRPGFESAVAFFARYAVCDAQQRAAPMGYAPLPVSLVAAGLQRIRDIPDADVAAIDITNCANPAIGAGGTDLLPSTVPMPPECDRVGPAQCPDGTGGLSNIPTPVLPPGPTRSNVMSLTATPGAPGSGVIGLSWTAPGPNTPAADPVSYAVSWIGPTPGSATVPFGTNTYAATGLAAGSYTFTVIATYADAPTAGTPAASASASASPSSVVIQDISTTRPVGALVLTQVCSSNGAIPSDPTPTVGFPTGVPAVPARNASTVGNPTRTGTAPTTTRAGTADPNVAKYPYPTDDATLEAEAAYPTYCGIDLGRARFVTEGAGAGQFFAVTGVIDQITIVDTRDDDTGWTVSGQMSDFSANGGTDTFSGSQLGWAPMVSEDTQPFADSYGTTYDQVAQPGPAVSPNTPDGTGLGAGSVLMQSAAGHGLGIAIADARLRLLIPVTADAGRYTGTLTINAA